MQANCHEEGSCVEFSMDTNILARGLDMCLRDADAMYCSTYYIFVKDQNK